jgi:hypothetical protein
MTKVFQNVMSAILSNDYFALTTMSIESIENFTALAAERWIKVKSDMCHASLLNVWCDTCEKLRTLTDLSGVVRHGDLLITGKCSVCHGKMARVVDNE